MNIIFPSHEAHAMYLLYELYHEVFFEDHDPNKLSMLRKEARKLFIDTGVLDHDSVHKNTKTVTKFKNKYFNLWSEDKELHTFATANKSKTKSISGPKLMEHMALLDKKAKRIKAIEEKMDDDLAKEIERRIRKNEKEKARKIRNEAIERTILSCLQKYIGASIKTIALKTGMTRWNVYHRVNKMVKNGDVIKRAKYRGKKKTNYYYQK